ncbi:hypothetical protein [Krasilnikovia sp. MM14-A1004]|uniref:hypothetical protein n=1 Tax=Krasilnikovia sp. MM14-A1004 TaxID=3373541 RepID=UPI00399C8512
MAISLAGFSRSETPAHTNSGKSTRGIGQLGVLENIFHGFGRVGHEIVFVFGCHVADHAIYERDAVGEILDDAGTKVMWRSLNSFNADNPLYPAGLTALLRGE